MLENLTSMTLMRTLYVPNVKLVKNDGHPMYQKEYAHIIGSLMYLMNCTRPDIAYFVNRLSRYNSNLERIIGRL